MTRSRLAKRIGPLPALVFAAATVAAAALAYPEMPEQMALHWRIGLDGEVSTGTVVPRRVGSFLLPATAAAAALAAVPLSARLREREPELGTAFDVLAATAVLALAGLQALLFVLNAG